METLNPDHNIRLHGERLVQAILNAAQDRGDLDHVVTHEKGMITENAYHVVGQDPFSYTDELLVKILKQYVFKTYEERT